MADIALQFPAFDMEDDKACVSAPALWLTLSFFLHVLVFASLWFASIPRLEQAANSAAGNRLELILTRAAPEPSVPAETASLESRQIPAVLQPEEVAESGEASATAEQVPAPASVETGQATAAVQSSTESISTISADQLQHAVTAYVNNYRSELAASTQESCQRYRNKHGVRECPQDKLVLPADEAREVVAEVFRSWAGGYSENERESRKLQEEMDLMRPLLKTSGLLGELARQRYYLAKDNYDYLNPDSGNRPVVGLVHLDFLSGKLVILSGWITFDIKDGFKAGEEALKDARGPAQPYRKYEFTGEKAQSAEAENEFSVQAPLFPLRR